MDYSLILLIFLMVTITLIGTMFYSIVFDCIFAFSAWRERRREAKEKSLRDLLEYEKYSESGEYLDEMYRRVKK